MLRIALSILALILGLSSPVQAQDRATLLADSILVVGGNRLIAEGSVEVFYQGQHLTASRLLFDATLQILTIEGPIGLADGNGNILLADQAQLSADLTQGILTSARLVLADQLQLAAAEVVRSDSGRMSGLVRVVASSCNVCAGRAPLWEIRATSVLHDAEARQLYFSGAQLRFAGVPVFYLPRLRLPDPTQDRASGFLIPQITTSTKQGIGVSIPYFLTLGPSRDLTFTPFATTRSGRALTVRYRQAVRSGTFEINGSAAQDRLLNAPLRWHLEGQGSFALPLGFLLTTDGILVSDRAYLTDYRLSDSDRLDSRAVIDRTRRNEYFSAQLISFQSLRDGEDNETLPVAVADLVFHRRFSGGPLGGQAGFRLEAHGHYRLSHQPLDLDANGIADGRDLGRVNFAGDWQRSAILNGGAILTATAEVSADYYTVEQDAVFAGNHLRGSAIASADLRWPLIRSGPEGGSQIVEPKIQLVIAPGADNSIPNEDSALVEFDEGNLFALSRFPGVDAYESGIHLNAGISTYLTGQAGQSLSITAGRVFRLDPTNQFSETSGLGGTSSNWLFAMSVDAAPGLSMTGRMLADPNLSPEKIDLRLQLAGQASGLTLGMTELSADPAEGREADIRELVFDGHLKLSSNWTASGGTRLDLANRVPVSAGAGLDFTNECLKVNLSISRRFTTSTNVDPATNFGLTVELLGFGGGKTGPSTQCRR